MTFQHVFFLPYPLSTLESGRHRGMSLELLEHLEWVEVGVGVVQADDEAHRHQVVLLQMVQEAASKVKKFVQILLKVSD